VVLRARHSRALRVIPHRHRRAARVSPEVGSGVAAAGGKQIQLPSAVFRGAHPVPVNDVKPLRDDRRVAPLAYAGRDGIGRDRGGVHLPTGGRPLERRGDATRLVGAEEDKCNAGYREDPAEEPDRRRATATGLSGVVADSVARRLPEIAIRVALGATRSRVLALVVREGLVIVVVGLLVGSIASIAMRGIVSHLLFGVHATDAATYAGVALTIIGTAAAACAAPSWRALKAEPARLLRGP
jgi:hypothetical protein